jgi:hypothetical protein
MASAQRLQTERGRSNLMSRWNEVQEGGGRSGGLGKRVMGRAGEKYVPNEEQVTAAASFRGRVNNDVKAAMMRGDFSKTATRMVALDVMKKWKPKTQDAKEKAVRQFMGFLDATGRKREYFPERQDLRGGRWRAPTAAAEEQTLMEFAVMRVMAGASPDTAGGSVSHVRTWSELMMDKTYGKVGVKGKASLTSNYLAAMKATMYYPEEDSKDVRREPVTWEMVKMFEKAASMEGRRDVGVAIAIAFAGLFRMGELTSTDKLPFSANADLSERDVEFAPTFWTATSMTVSIGRTKADQSGKKGRLRPRILPVEVGSPAMMVRTMLARRHGVGRGEEPVLRRVPLFQNARKGHLSRDSVMKFMRTTLTSAGWSAARTKRYGTHSCRIGGCTALILMGATAEVIKEMGGWSSDAYKAYIRLKQQNLMSFSSKMCQDTTAKVL